MNKNYEKKEIRSKKVRKILNEKPPFLIRYGTLIIFIILALFVTLSILVTGD